MIVPNNVVGQTLVGLEHWHCLWGLTTPLVLDWGAYSGILNKSHSLGVEVRCCLCIPSSLHSLRRLLRTKP